MANLAITADQVKFVQGEAPIRGTFGSTVTAGMLVYQDSDDNKFYPGNCRQTSNGPAKVVGPSLSSGVAGQEGSIQTDGIIDIGATAAPIKGTTYVLAGTDGLWMPIADQTTGDWCVMVAVAGDNNQMHLAMNNFGIRKP